MPAAEPAASTLAGAIEHAARLHPANIALQQGETRWTYAQLDDATTRVAAPLQDAGVGPEDIVAIALPRSVEFFVAALGIWKAGGAFLPLDPEGPRERLSYMLANAAPKTIIAGAEFGARFGVDTMTLDAARIASAPTISIRGAAAIPPERAAYVIYTSGSTGVPKGVLVTHKGLLSLAKDQAARMGIDPQSRVAQLAAFTFDAAVSEMAMTLLRGATLVIAGQDERAGQPLSDFLTREGITHATLTPTALAATPVSGKCSLRSLIVAGEAAAASVIAPWASRYAVLNGYGPTEASVCATMSDALRPGEDPPIGKPRRTSASMCWTNGCGLPCGCDRRSVHRKRWAGARLSRGCCTNGRAIHCRRSFWKRRQAPVSHGGSLVGERTATRLCNGRSDDQLKIPGIVWRAQGKSRLPSWRSLRSRKQPSS